MRRAHRSSIAPLVIGHSALANQPFTCVLQALLAPAISIDDTLLHLPDPEAEAAFAAAEARADVERVRRSLSRREWSLLEDEYFASLPQTIIARRRGVSPAAISKARRRALSKARRVLSGAHC